MVFVGCQSIEDKELKNRLNQAGTIDTVEFSAKTGECTVLIEWDDKKQGQTSIKGPRTWFRTTSAAKHGGSTTS